MRRNNLNVHQQSQRANGVIAVTFSLFCLLGIGLLRGSLSDMVLIHKVVEVSASPEDAFKYLSEFQHTLNWDPGCTSSVVSKSSPVTSGLGTIYDLVTVFQGQESEMKYEITEYTYPTTVTLVGSSDTVKAVDTVTVTAGSSAGTATVEYKADIRLKGLLKLATPFVRGSILALGDPAIQGMKEAFERGDYKSGVTPAQPAA